MPQKRLTAAMVERISPPAKGQVEYWDKAMPGFGLRISYRGKKSWVLMTRVDGKLSRITLGDADIMTLADAHAAAREARRQAKAGIHPREERRRRQGEAAEARALTFSAMADQFLGRYAKPRLKSRSIVAYIATLKGDRTQAWQDKPIASIGRRDVMALLDGLEAEGKNAMAKVTLAHFRKFFGWGAQSATSYPICRRIASV